VSVELNRIIIPARSKWASATFLASILDVPAGPPREPFVPVTVGNGVTLDFVDAVGFDSHHCAFLVSEAEFDAAFARIRGAGLPFYAEPRHRRPGELNHLGGGRGVCFDDPDEHSIEITTRPAAQRERYPLAAGGPPRRMTDEAQQDLTTEST
jgi:catechol 2,3-dioxygenase-like lactoylglutathione lyase family enzyme